nr:hypothetical protein [Flavobacterium sp.]
MRFLKKLLDFYINSSIHVALSGFALVQLTYILFDIENDNATLGFTFFGIIVSYNFVKYHALARAQKSRLTVQLKAIFIMSLFSLFAASYYFFQLQRNTQIMGFVFLIITLLYTLPVFPNKRNARNWAGFKIYIVALCWVGVTLFLPIINNHLPYSRYVFLVAMQRFLLLFVLILIFEIVDLKSDDPHLKTVPQQIGVEKTKLVGFALLFLFVVLEFLSIDLKVQFFLLKCCLAFTTLLFLIFVNESRSRYYTSFWVESIPMIWWILILVFS